LKNRILLYSAIVLAGLAAVSCTKEPDLIGLDLLPATDKLYLDYSDTVSLVAYTVREDSLRTDELSLSLLGSINDPEFGVTTASIYTQFQLPKNNVTFGENAVADSMVLTMSYKGIYGDSLAPKTIRIYEMADTISYDSTYFSNHTVPVMNELVGSATFVPNLKEADSVGGYYVPPHMRIVLNPAFANKLITADTNDLKDNVSFQKVFKGLYLTSDEATTPGTGSMLYLSLIDVMGHVRLYYHNSTDTASLDFPFGSFGARFNHFDHNNYSGANPALLQQLNGDTTAGSQKLFIQSMAGSKIKIRIPDVKALVAQKKMALNEAVLVFKVADTSGTYQVPTQLILRKLNSDGSYAFLTDETEGAAFIDGKSRSGKEYRFRITRYLQHRLLNPDEADYGLMMFATGAALGADRTIISGTGAGDNKIKLLLYYTPVE